MAAKKTAARKRMSPFERCPGESAEAFAAYLIYRDLGPERAIPAVRERFGEGSGKSARLLERWSSRNQWVERSRAWDNFQQAERDKVIAREAVRWEERRQKHREDVYQLGEALREKAMRMAAWPVSQQTIKTEGDKKITIIEPSTRWGFRDAAVMGKLSAELIAAAIDGYSDPNAGKPGDPNAPAGEGGPQAITAEAAEAARLAITKALGLGDEED